MEGWLGPVLSQEDMSRIYWINFVASERRLYDWRPSKDLIPPIKCSTLFRCFSDLEICKRRTLPTNV